MKKLLLTTSILLLAAACNNNQQAQVQPVQNQATSTSQAAQSQPQATSTDNTSDWKTYSNDKFDFSIQYPPQYEVTGQSPESVNSQQAEPYLVGIDLIQPGPRYNLMSFDIWDSNTKYDTVVKEIKNGTGPYQFSILDNNGNPDMPIAIGNVNGYSYTGNYYPALYYFQSPNSENTFVVKCEQCTKPTDFSIFYQILNTFKFTK